MRKFRNTLRRIKLSGRARQRTGAANERLLETHDEIENENEDNSQRVVAVPSTENLALQQIDDEIIELAEKQEEEYEKEALEKVEHVAKRRKESSLSIQSAMKYFLEANADEDSDSDGDTEEDDQPGDYTNVNNAESRSVRSLSARRSAENDDDDCTDCSDNGSDSDAQSDSNHNHMSARSVRARIRSRMSSVGAMTVASSLSQKAVMMDIDTEWDHSLLLELGRNNKDLLWHLLEYLKVQEAVEMSALSQEMSVHLRGDPLRLDSMGRVIHLRDLEKIYKPVKFKDGITAPKWHVSGVVSGVSDLNVLFELVDPRLMKSFGVANKSLKDISRIVECTQVEKAEFHSCGELVNIRPLRNLKTLKILFLLCCKNLKHLQPIAALTNLKTLNLYECAKINDISPIGWLTGLVQLGLAKCTQVQDHSPLSTLTNLEFVDLTENILLKNVDFLKDAKRIHLLYLTNCTELNDISGLGECGNNLKVLRLNGCANVKDISALSVCHGLFHLKLDGLINLKDLSPLRSCPSLKDLFLTNCAEVTGLENIRESMSSMFTLSLAGCTSLKATEASVLSLSKKLMILELSGASADFLVQLLVSDVFFVRKTAKAVIIRDCENRRGFSVIMRQAVVSQLLPMVDWESSDENNNNLRDVLLKALSEIAHDSKAAADALYDGVFRTLINFLKEKDIPMMSKRSAQALILALINRSKKAVERFEKKDSGIVSVFVDFVLNGYDGDEETYCQEAILAMQILGSVLGKLNDTVNHRLQKERIVRKRKTKELVDRIASVNKMIENSGMLNHLLRIIDRNYKDDFSKGAAYSLLLNFVTNAGIANKAGSSTERENSNNGRVESKNELPEVLLDKAVPLILNSLDRIPVNVKMVAAGLLVALIGHGGNRARNVVMTKPGIIAFIKDLMMSGDPISLANGNGREIEQEQLEMSGSFIKVASELMQVLPTELYPRLMESEIVQSMIAPLEHSASKVLDTRPHMYITFDNSNGPDAVYAQNIVSMTRALYAIASDPTTCKKIGDSIPKAVPVIPLVLHSAIEDKTVYLDSAKLLLRLLDGSEIYRSKVQLVYSNSEIMVSLRVFLSATTEEEKLLGLKILDILLESHVFIEKLIDCNAKDLADFQEEFSKYVFRTAREDNDVVEVAARMIGKGVKNDSNQFTLLKAFIIPEINELRRLCETPPTALASAFNGEEKQEEELDDEPILRIFQNLLFSFGSNTANHSNEENEEQNNGNRRTFRVPLLGNILDGDDHGHDDSGARSNDIEELSEDDRQNILDKVAGRVTTVALFLENLIGKNGAVATMGAIDDYVLGMLYRFILESGPGAKLAHESILRLFATMFQLLENLNEPMYKPEGFVDRHVLSDTELPMPNMTPIDEIPEPENNNVAESGDDSSTTDSVQDSPTHPFFLHRDDEGEDGSTAYLQQEMRRRMTEQRRELEGAEAQRVMDRNRKQKLLQKLSNDLKRSHKGEKDIPTSTKKNKHSSAAKLKMRALWETLCGSEATMGQTMDICADTLNTNVTQYGSSGALDLLVGFCSYAGTTYSERLFVRRGDIVGHLRTFLMLESDTRFAACKLAVFLGKTNPMSLQEHILVPLAANLVDIVDKKKPIATVKALAAILKFDSTVDILTNTNIGEQLVTYFISTTEVEMKEEKLYILEESGSVLAALLLRDVVDNDPKILVKILQSDVGKLGQHFVKLLLGDEKINTLTTELSGVVVGLLNNVLSSNDEESLTKLAESLVDSGVLEILKNWADRANNPGSEYHDDKLVECGLMVLELSLHLKDCSILEEVGLYSIIPVLVKLLMDSPSAKFASLLTRISRRALRHDDYEYISEQFLGYPSFKESIDKETEIMERQRSDGDIIFCRVRGLPQEVEYSRKYHVSFGDTWTTVAVKPEDDFIHSESKLYFEVEILHAKGEGRIGWITENYEHGELLGELVHGIGEDDESWAFESKGTSTKNIVTTHRSWKKHDIIGVLADVSSGTFQFSINGKILKNVAINVDKDKIKNGIFPAISASRMECQVNLGTKPFKHSPQMDDYVAFKSAFEY